MSWSTRADIVAKVRKRWDTGEFLTAYANGSAWAPVELVLRSPKARDIADSFDGVREWADSWRGQDDLLHVEYAPVGGRLIGGNSLPARVRIDGYEQLWSLLGVGRQVRRFVALVARTRAVAAEVADWMVGHPHAVLAFSDETWQKILDTVLWISDHDSSMYVRQVDVPGVDTKFVEGNRKIIGTLLDLRLPESRIDPRYTAADFVARYRFLRKPQYVRYRWLDPACGTGGFSEVNVRIDELARIGVPASNVFVLENETTYLAFPDTPDAVAIFGGGYSVTRLYGLTWLHDKTVTYWGDIDTHGFTILDTLRTGFPATRSLLMDRATLLAHRTQWVREDKPVRTSLTRLTPVEADLYRDLVEDSFGPAVRLEQERVRYSAVEDALKEPGTSPPV